ncbi:unnamed protein product [Periconia digitata]|uniref:Uncharacterized protein n=1 Tax=Periconia digitata TaxID=1303443 RepID=A0A9W4XSJ2_9PLEO|nr:unnamed protein product [Periconia digitata]
MTKPRADLYYYTPTFTGAVITASIFCVLAIIHAGLLFRTKTWFCTPLLIGALCEVVGFTARAYSHSNKTYSTTNAGPLIALIIQACLILLAPVLFSATVYMFLGRIMRATGQTALSPLNIRYLTKIFVWCDIILLNLQSTGASLFTNSRGKAWMSDLGRAIVLVGLVAQIGTFGFFVTVAGRWHWRMNNLHPRSIAMGGFRWERPIYMLYGVSAIITGRNLYRVTEFAMGGKLIFFGHCWRVVADRFIIEDGYLNVNEWPVYALDAAFMIVVLSICAFWYVGNIHERNQRRESVELMVQGESIGEGRAKEKDVAEAKAKAKASAVLNIVFLGVPGLVLGLLKRRRT